MNETNIDRRELLPQLFPDPARYLMISGLAGASRDAAALTGEADYLLTMGGAMGAAVSMGLGVALAAPESEVAVITGDGELLMNVGSLATVASMMPENLTIVCIDNGRHGETGGQLGHTARRTNLAVMAEGAGIPSVMAIESTDEIAGAVQFLTESPGPRFLLCRVMDGPPAPHVRNFNLAECRQRFRDAFLSRQRSGGAAE